MKILIGYDGSECSQLALGDLKRAGLPADCEAIVIAAAEASFPVESVHEPAGIAAFSVAEEKAGEITEQAIEWAEHNAYEAERWLAASFPRWQIRTKSLFEGAAQALLTNADVERPDLIVVGSHGRSWLGRMILGSVSQKVLSHAAVSVRIARGSSRELPHSPRIIVGVDGSTDSMIAFREVERRVWPVGTEIVLVAANDLQSLAVLTSESFGPGEWVDSEGQDDETRLQLLLGALTKRLVTKGLKVRTTIDRGHPAEILLNHARRWGADCIVVGARGLGSVRRFLIGSVSQHVAAHAECSVEVVRAGY